MPYPEILLWAGRVGVGVGKGARKRCGSESSYRWKVYRTVIGYRWWFYVCLCWCSSQNCARWIHFFKWQKDTNSSRWQDETIFTWAYCLNNLVKKTPATLVVSAWEDDLKVPSKGPSLLPCTWWTSRPNRTWKVRKYKAGGSITKGMKKEPKFLRFVFF